MSADVGLGTPFNTAQAAALQNLVAHLTGRVARYLTVFMGDAHLYVNQLDYINEQLLLEPKELPRLVIQNVPRARFENIQALIDSGEMSERQIDVIVDEQISWLGKVEPSDFSLEGYDPHILSTATPKMAV